MDSVKLLLKNLCCSICKKDFEDDDITVLEKNGNIHICSLKCGNCGKDFGEILLTMNNRKSKSSLEIVDGAPAINIDDIIDAHNYIRDNF